LQLIDDPIEPVVRIVIEIGCLRNPAKSDSNLLGMAKAEIHMPNISGDIVFLLLIEAAAQTCSQLVD